MNKTKITTSTTNKKEVILYIIEWEKHSKATKKQK